MNQSGSLDRGELTGRIGDIRQLAGYQRFMLMEGRGKGNEIIQVRNGSGLLYQVQLQFDQPPATQDGTLMVYTRSARDGSIQDLVEIPVTF